MYIKSLSIENAGPVRRLEYQFPYTSDGKPKPVVLVGGNGSGKSIVLSHIVNSLLSAQQTVFDDTEVEKGKVYKYRSAHYITTGEHFYFSKVEFEEELQTVEWQLDLKRTDFEKKYGFTPNRKEWTRIPEGDTSIFWNNMAEKKDRVEGLFLKNCVVYFPANRFEEPGWLNYDNLTSRADFSDLKHVQGRSNRSIIQYSPLQRNRDWLLDVILDRQLYDIKIFETQTTTSVGIARVPLFAGYAGPSMAIYEAAQDVTRRIVQGGNDVRLGFGPRANRKLSLMRDEKVWVPDVFQLSTGETAVLNLFLSILRDYDVAGGSFNGLQNVRGIALIDEIDSHLHCDLQSKVLPSLIKMFPSVQFVMTTHSPLFLLGLRKELSDDGFTVLSLPDGALIGVERFEEFQRAYETMKDSSAYERDLTDAIKEARLPAIFVEGDYDIRYMQKGAELLGRSSLLEGVQLKDGSGFGNLDKVWKHFDSKLALVAV